MVLNSKSKLVYPGSRREGEGIRELYPDFTAMLTAGSLKAGYPTDLDDGKEKYAIELFEVESKANIRAKYFIAYAQENNAES